MTRIIAGAARGRRLQVPAAGTRPTSDRAREGLFSSLQTLLNLNGAAVLDLYAGSGAVGLEALSRGARSATLVEQDGAAARMLRANAASLGLDGVVVVQRPVAEFLRQPGGGAFDLVFADPPYALSEAELSQVLDLLCGGNWLTAEAVVVIERSARGDEIHWPEALEYIKQKRYGEALLWYGQHR